jgi:predicted transcriptional regulator
VGLITKNLGNSFTLTPYGEQILTQLKGLEFTSKYNQYFREHTLNGLPLTFRYRIGELSNCTFIDDVMVVFRNMEQMINESEGYLLRVTDRYSLITMHAVERAYQRGVWQHLLDPEDIVVPPDFDNGPIIQSALKRGQYIDFKEVSALAFPTINGRFDYTGFASKDPSFHRWCKELFEHYWSKGKPKPPDWLQKKNLESKKKAQV